MTFEFHDVTQTSDDWFSLRLGKPGGSKASVYMAHDGKKTAEGKDFFGDPALDFARNLAVERLTHKRVDNGFQPSAAMLKGVEEEPIARELYSATTFNEVTNGGWFDVDETHGTSPDGLVDDDGCIEIKCTGIKAFWATVSSKSYDRGYHWQLINHLEVTGRDWVDYVNYCSEMPDYARLFIYRLNRKDYIEDIMKLRARRNKFISKIAESMIEIEEMRNVK